MQRLPGPNFAGKCAHPLVASVPLYEIISDTPASFAHLTGAAYREMGVSPAIVQITALVVMRIACRADTNSLGWPRR